MAKLFGSLTSPFVRHCRIAFLEQKLAFEFVPTDYAQSAANSPTQKVPFFVADGIQLTDSTAIVQWIRQQGNQAFIPKPESMNLYATANTVLDAAINLFLLEKENVLPANVPYLRRQENRIATSLQYLNATTPPLSAQPSDAQWRVACLLDWALYRKRFTFDHLPNLIALHREACIRGPFKETSPP